MLLPSNASGIGAPPSPFPLFPDLDSLFATFDTNTFGNLPTWEQLQRVFRLLLEQIHQAQAPTFLLPAIIVYLERLNTLHLLSLHVSFSLFEFWLNHFSHLSPNTQAQVRGKITGKYLPREEYGRLFPISLGKMHFGSHFVSAHLAPDLDTTVASFIGWLDAFATQVGTGQHIWNLPGGPSQEQISVLFTKLFGPAFFSILAHTEGSMRLSAMDLLTTDSILYANGSRTLTHLDHHMGNTAILYVDEHGFYQGDWRGSNFEPVEQITTLFDRVMRAFAHAIHVDLLALFAQAKSPKNSIAGLYSRSFSQSLASVLEGIERDSPHKQRLDLFCKTILLLQDGLSSSFQALFSSLSTFHIPQVAHFLKEVQALDDTNLAEQGSSFEDFEEGRMLLFRLLYRLVHSLDQTVDAIARYIDRLDVVMRIKHDVLGYQPSCATLHADLETLRLSVGERDYLTIVLVDEEGRRTPLGVVRATTLRKERLGTVSQRDFSNPDEMRMASYLTVISVMDHHKSTLHTHTPIQALLADAQACNVLVAEQCFLLNDRYGTGGVALEQVDAQLKKCIEELDYHQNSQNSQNNQNSLLNNHLLQRLLRKKAILAHETEYYIHPLREYIEYFYCLHAILDDTDLLSKVGMRDVQCVASLLSRLKTLCTGKEAEVISLEGLSETPEDIKRAAERLLQTPDLHALYIALHQQREKEVEHALIACARDGDMALFSDTKQQNDCCRIGQIKLFQGNQSTYMKYADTLLKVWLHEARAREKHDPEYDLHLMMISTLKSPTRQEESESVSVVHAKGKQCEKQDKEQGEKPEKQEKYQDALWIWAAPTPMGLSHLTRFLSTFQHLPIFQKTPPWVTLYGAKKREWQEVFMQNFRVVESIQLENWDEARSRARDKILDGNRNGTLDGKEIHEDRNGTRDGNGHEICTFAVIHYPCGTVNSRKTMISPFLPSLMGCGA